MVAFWKMSKFPWTSYLETHRAEELVSLTWVWLCWLEESHMLGDAHDKCHRAQAGLAVVWKIPGCVALGSWCQEGKEGGEAAEDHLTAQLEQELNPTVRMSEPLFTSPFLSRES